MSAHSLRINNRTLYLQKAIGAPAFGHPTILVEDNWDFVEMWLKKQKRLKNALFFWSQAQSFYKASSLLPKTAAPLTAYYAALNATKALLLAKGQAFSPSHGLSGKNTGDKTSLANEMISVKGAGVLPSLCSYLGEPSPASPLSLKQILYNLPFVHRAFCTTYTTANDLFIPIQDACFVRKEKSDESWFCCTVTDRRYKNTKIFSSLPGYEQDISITDKFIIRRKQRFRWKHKRGHRSQNIANLTLYHKKVRKDTYYIHGLTRLWYLKRHLQIPDIIDQSSLTLMFMALHRLSELARYSPDTLARHFACRHNFLLSQFITRSLDQFIDEVSAEITGNDFMLPSYATR